jgi:oxygen-independent coproporphyrinogen-3 oxidase
LPTLSLYIHFPWCIRKCPYCDFNSHAVKAGIPEQAYIEALLNDLRKDLRQLPDRSTIQTIFMGGGTPSLFSPQALEQLFVGIRGLVDLAADCEITLEANPGTFEAAKFRAFRQLGINRLSIGVQSFNDRHLQSLGRVHSADEARNAVDIAFQAGFENLNLDLMFGLPGQTTQEMLEDIATSVSLQPTHLSYYQLTLEPNTYFHKFPPSLPEDDAIFTGQKLCQQLLAEHGYQQYEISAYARSGYSCRHNQNYWQFGDYLGIGAGAHGKLSLGLPDRIIRTQKVKSPEQYLQAIAIRSESTVAVEQLALEFVMNQLRLKAGFNLGHYQAITGLTLDTLEPALSSCIRHGLLVQQGLQICCSDRGWDFLDDILEKFIP